MAYEDNYQNTSEPKYECLLFDLDDTLYPFSSGLSVQVTKNIREYMTHKLHIEESIVPELCLSLYKEYGTTMAGLKAIGYDFDYDDFHSFVHGRLPYDLLKPDPVLRQLLLSLPVRKLVFTNADKAHAHRALNRLGLEDCFEGIICFETLNSSNPSSSAANIGSPVDIRRAETSAVSSDEAVSGNSSSSSSSEAKSVLSRTPVVICKPFEEAFERVFKVANVNPHKTLFFDDSFRNLQTGKQMGLHTVLIGTSHRTIGADYALESIHNIREALPELWEADEKSNSIRYSRKVSIETPVEA